MGISSILSKFHNGKPTEHPLYFSTRAMSNAAYIRHTYIISNQLQYLDDQFIAQGWHKNIHTRLSSFQRPQPLPSNHHTTMVPPCLRVVGRA